MLSVLRQRQWVMLALAIVVVSALCIVFGRWQWHRHEERRTQNAAVTASSEQAQTPIGSLLSPNDSITSDVEFRTVTIRGTYDSEHQLLWRNPRGRSGFTVLTPLVPEAGPALLIERGWTPFSNSDPGLPAVDITPADGPVQVVARLRVDQPRDDREAPQGQVYTVNSEEAQAELPYLIYPGYAELVSQDPSRGDELEPPEIAPLGLGPHLFYAYQWWFFAGLAVVGYFLLARREATSPRAGPADDRAPRQRVEQE